MYQIYQLSKVHVSDLSTEPRREKTGLGDFRPGALKSACTVTEVQARGLKYWLQVEDELYYPSRENKGADQLGSDCTADLRL